MFELIIEMLFVIPGAFIKWLFTGCKKPLKEHMFDGDAYLDGIIGLTTVVLIAVFIRYLFF